MHGEACTRTDIGIPTWYVSVCVTALGTPASCVFYTHTNTDNVLADRCTTILPIAGAGRVLVTGGASSNKSILQIIADVFQSDVYVQAVSDSAALGCAYRAVYGSY